MVFRVQTLNQISDVGLTRFPPGAYDVGSDVDNPDALLLRSANLHGALIPDSVLAIARAGAGTNNIPVAACSARGIPVFNTPGANANAVKELVIAALLLAARHIIPAAAFAHRLDGDADTMERAVESGKKDFVGFELPGRVLGVIGLGAVGLEVANAAATLGMRVLGYDPAITIDHAWRLSPAVEHITTIDRLLDEADFVSIHVPLLDATRGMIGAAQLARLSKSAVLVNFARGPIVDEAAVIEALESGRLGGYVCDFPSPNLNKRRGVVTLPHLGASTFEAEENCARMAADELRAFLEHGTVHNSVNFPDAELARQSGDHRLAIVNSNVPSIVGQISTLLAEAGLNIANLLNRSRGELAYSLIDVDGAIPDTLVARLLDIDGVIAARVI